MKETLDNILDKICGVPAVVEVVEGKKPRKNAAKSNKIKMVKELPVITLEEIKVEEIAM